MEKDFKYYEKKITLQERAGISHNVMWEVPMPKNMTKAQKDFEKAFRQLKGSEQYELYERYNYEFNSLIAENTYGDMEL